MTKIKEIKRRHSSHRTHRQVPVYSALWLGQVFSLFISWLGHLLRCQNQTASSSAISSFALSRCTFPDIFSPLSLGSRRFCPQLVLDL